MSKHKHNYTQYSNKPKTVASEVKMESIPTPLNKTEPVEVKPVLETVETVALPKTVDGMVVGCAKLNVRAEANLFSDVVCVLDARSEIEIDVEKSDKDWFYICTAAGIEGYCMRKYVEAHL